MEKKYTTAKTTARGSHWDGLTFGEFVNDMAERITEKKRRRPVFVKVTVSIFSLCIIPLVQMENWRQDEVEKPDHQHFMKEAIKQR